VNRERRNSQVLQKLQCLNDGISRRRCSSRAAIFTYLPAGLQFEYVAGAQWFHERICAHWLSDWNCRHRMEGRFGASGKTRPCAAGKEVRLHMCYFVQRDPFRSLHWPPFFKGQVSNDIFPLGFCDHSSFAEMRFCDHSFFSKLCSQSSHLTALPVKHWLIAEVVRQTVTHYKVAYVFFSWERVFLDMINYIFSTHLQLSNGEPVSLQQETRLYVSGFPLGWLIRAYCV